MTAQTERRSLPARELMAQAGKLEAVSGWITVTQDMIDAFADVTRDHQFIHVDPVKAAEAAPFGGTIAHGFLTLSLLSAMAMEALPVAREMAMGINYGLDRIRFLAPVPSGARIRGRFRLAECGERKPGELRSRYEVSIEIEGIDTPALVADWLTVAILGDQERTGDNGA